MLTYIKHLIGSHSGIKWYLYKNCENSYYTNESTEHKVSKSFDGLPKCAHLLNKFTISLNWSF